MILRAHAGTEAATRPINRRPLASAAAAPDPGRAPDARAHAAAVLRSLERDREELAGAPDAVAGLTGQSAIDRAIDATRALIERLEHDRA